MSNLNNNTTQLEALLVKINELPEASPGTDTSDATATADEIFAGETAYTADGKVTGTFTIEEELTTQDNLITQIAAALEGKAAGGADPVLQAKTVTPSTSTQTVSPDSGYDGLSSVTVNAMPTATQATPSITVNSAGLITAAASQTAGYVSAGVKSATKQLTTQAAKTITPSTSSQTAVASGVYTTGAITVAGDANLVAANIAEGVSIFGITGTYSGESSGGVNPPDISGGSSSNSNVVELGFVQSTATGSIIWVANTLDEITTVSQTLTYLSAAKKYRYMPYDLLANTPIIVLTSGTITMPFAYNGYTCETIATGTGYGIYQYVASSGGDEDPI